MIDLELYADNLINEGKSKNTIEGYKRNIILYEKWFREKYHRSFNQLHRENILQYKEHLKNEKRYTAETINNKISSLRSFNDFLIKKNIQSEWAIITDDYIQIQNDLLSPFRIDISEIESFIQAVLESGNKRDYAIVMIFAYTGIRISELTAIQLNDFNLESQDLIIRDGKGEKQRSVILNKKTVRAIKNYLNVRNEKYKKAKGSPYLFVSQKSKLMHRSAVNRMFGNYSVDITPHELRHFFCTNALAKGFTLLEVKEMAGHDTIRTTEKYLHPSKQEIKDKTDRL